ncbi:hypothetical protein Hanom_Chr12g01065661 [Helianthus anomalus]
MLQKLEKEIDDVDAKIGDRWGVLDRCIIGIHEVPKDSALGRLKGSDNARSTVE